MRSDEWLQRAAEEVVTGADVLSDEGTNARAAAIALDVLRKHRDGKA